MKYQIINGNNIDVLKTFPDNHFDSIVTDPPYGIDFLGKAWDANTGALETYQECLRVLKPGGHILAFSAARTYHHLAVTLEQAGFEIRDQIMWIYSSGFPKSQDIGRQLHKKQHGKPDKQRFDPAVMIHIEGDRYRHPDTNKIYRALPDINGDRLKISHEGQKYGTVYEEVISVDNEWTGWGTALKPAHEPIALARKPMKGAIRDNVVKWGTGALNIDATRVPYESEEDKNSIDHKVPTAAWSGHTIAVDSYVKGAFEKVETNELGRFPSNVLGEIPDYQKYFYCPKVSRRERHIGFELPPPMFGGVQGAYGPDGERFAVGFDARAEGKTKKKKHDPLAHIPTNPAGIWDVDGTGVQYNSNKNTNIGNNHPTVKPIELMKYLIKLITPKGGRVLDPFNGSGSTGCAAVELGCEYVGIELDPNYVEIAKKRIEAWNKEDTTFKELFE
jgi:site-specific DNA-methyltransferase (adenine-specific)